MNFCPKCRKKLVVQDFCVECGADLSEYLNQADSVPSAADSLSSFDFSHLAAEAEAQLAEQEKLKDFEIENGVLKKYRGNGGSVVIPSEAVEIGYAAFYDCKSVTSVIFHSGVRRIADFSFSGCGLTSVLVPEGITMLEESTFSGCENLKSVSLPKSLRVIGASAFSGCGSLIDVQMQNNVSTIESSAFNFCTSLTNISIPGSVSSIHKWAFTNCPSLTSVVFGEGIRVASDEAYFAFAKCKNLKTVKAPRYWGLKFTEMLKFGATYKLIEY